MASIKIRDITGTDRVYNTSIVSFRDANNDGQFVYYYENGGGEVAVIEITTDSGTLSSTDLDTITNSDSCIIKNTTTGNLYRLVSKTNSKYICRSASYTKDKRRNSDTTNLCIPDHIITVSNPITAEYDLETDSIHFYGTAGFNGDYYIGVEHSSSINPTYFSGSGITSSGLTVYVLMGNSSAVIDMTVKGTFTDDFSTSYSGSYSHAFFRVRVTSGATYDAYLKLQSSSTQSSYVSYYVPYINSDTDKYIEVDPTTGAYRTFVYNFLTEAYVTQAIENALNAADTEFLQMLYGTSWTNL